MTFATGRVPHAGSRQPGASTEEQPVQSHKEKITKDIILIEKKEAKLPFFGRLYDSLSIEKCWEPAGGPPPVAKVMRKEARHTQR